MSKTIEGLYYSQSHEWVKAEGNIAFIGITDYAQEALGSIVYVDMPQEDDTVDAEQDFGAVEITDQTEKLDNEIWRAAVVPDESQDKVAELEGKINNAEQALGVIEKYDTGKSPLFKTRRLVKKSRIGEILSDESKAEKEIRTILDLNENLNSLTERTNKLDSD